MEKRNVHSKKKHLEMDFSLVLDLLALSLSEVNSPAVQVADKVYRHVF